VVKIPGFALIIPICDHQRSSAVNFFDFLRVSAVKIPYLLYAASSSLFFTFDFNCAAGSAPSFSANGCVTSAGWWPESDSC